MNVEAAKLDVTQYAVQYELLRSQVMASAANPARGDTAADRRRGVGLALLLSEGMPGWLKTVETVLRAAIAPQAAEPTPHPRSPQSSAVHVWLPSVQLHEITTLLASLVLSTRPVAH